eukprot:TRINITY_DN6005_c0_g1_i3.p2 TRINITY_DN6005_c0_g1~~TRINITY_DN6005_c0_g1_i3.p2  ORF type:complete len:125 (-),score=30.79 TRINITY_DN6005_c0_g1_i3:92-466(-)
MVDEADFKAHGYNVTSEQTKALNDHYHDPKNRWALKEYNARGIGRNPDNYGQVDMYLLINGNEEIANVGYEFNGCPTISFSASIFTEEIKGLPVAVSYTHLTLPTILLVQISVVAVSLKKKKTT